MLHETISVFVKGDCQIVNISQGKGQLTPIVTFVAENIVGIFIPLTPNHQVHLYRIYESLWTPQNTQGGPG